jgi:hypothetical protein
MIFGAQIGDIHINFMLIFPRSVDQSHQNIRLGIVYPTMLFPMY